MNPPFEISPSTQLILDEIRKLLNKFDATRAKLDTMRETSSGVPVPTQSAVIGANIVADNWGGLFDGGDDSTERYSAAQPVVADDWGGLFDGGDDSTEPYCTAQPVVAVNRGGLFEQPAHILEELSATDAANGTVISLKLATSPDLTSFMRVLSCDRDPCDTIETEAEDKEDDKLHAISSHPDIDTRRSMGFSNTPSWPSNLTNVEVSIVSDVACAVSADQIRHENDLTPVPDSIHNHCAEDDEADDPVDPGPKFVSRTNFCISEGGEVAFQKLYFKGTEDIAIYQCFQLPGISDVLNYFLRDYALHRFEYGIPTVAFLAKLREGTYANAHPDSLDATVRRAEHLLHGNDFSDELGCEEANLDMTLLGYTRYCATSDLLVIEGKIYVAAHLVFDKMPRRYNIIIYPPHSYGVVLFGPVSLVQEPPEVFEEMSQQISEILWPPPVHISNKLGSASVCSAQCSVERNSVMCHSGRVWKPPWYVPIQQPISCMLAGLVESWKYLKVICLISGAAKTYLELSEHVGTTCSSSYVDVVNVSEFDDDKKYERPRILHVDVLAAGILQNTVVSCSCHSLARVALMVVQVGDQVAAIPSWPSYNQANYAATMLTEMEFLLRNFAATLIIDTDSKPNKGLCKFLQNHLEGDTFAVVYSKLEDAIKEELKTVRLHNSAVMELMRGLRNQFAELITGLGTQDLSPMSSKLPHNLSRYRLNFIPENADAMIIQAIGLLDLDKKLSNYAMRVREWYVWYFPKLTKIVTHNIQYALQLSVDHGHVQSQGYLSGVTYKSVCLLVFFKYLSSFCWPSTAHTPLMIRFTWEEYRVLHLPLLKIQHGFSGDDSIDYCPSVVPSSRVPHSWAPGGLPQLTSYHLLLQVSRLSPWWKCSFMVLWLQLHQNCSVGLWAGFLEPFQLHTSCYACQTKQYFFTSLIVPTYDFTELLVDFELLTTWIARGDFVPTSITAQFEFPALHHITSHCFYGGLVDPVQLLHLLTQWVSNPLLFWVSGCAEATPLLPICFARWMATNLLLHEKNVAEVMHVNIKPWPPPASIHSSSANDLVETDSVASKMNILDCVVVATMQNAEASHALSKDTGRQHSKDSKKQVIVQFPWIPVVLTFSIGLGASRSLSGGECQGLHMFGPTYGPWALA